MKYKNYDKVKKLVIFGAGTLGHLAYQFFQKDSEYDVVAFTVQKSYIKHNSDEFCGKPIVPFEEITNYYPPSHYDMFVALGWYKLNRNRSTIYTLAKEKGYTLANYIHKSVVYWDDLDIGDNCMVMEGSIIQPFVKIGNNVTIWSDCCIEHYAKIEDNCTLVAGCKVAGDATIRKNSFVGVGSLIGDGVIVEEDNFIAMGTVVRKATQKNAIYEGNPAKLNRIITAKAFLGVEDEN